MHPSVSIRTDWGSAEQQGKDPGSGRKVALDGRKCAQHQGKCIPISDQKTQAHTRKLWTMPYIMVYIYTHRETWEGKILSANLPHCFVCCLVISLCIYASYARVFSRWFFCSTVRRGAEQGLRCSWEERKAQSPRAGHRPQRNTFWNLIKANLAPAQ